MFYQFEENIQPWESDFENIIYSLSCVDFSEPIYATK